MQQQGLANQAMHGMLGQCQASNANMVPPTLIPELRARIAELEAKAEERKACLRKVIAERDELRARARGASIHDEERQMRLEAADHRANALSDSCGQLRSENDRLTLENARLRRRLGE